MPPPSRPILRTLLVADIGATHSRVRVLQEDGDLLPTAVWTSLHSTEPRANHLKELLAAEIDAIAMAGLPPPRCAVVGLPGKINSERTHAALSYLDPYEFVDYSSILSPLGIRHLSLLNDLECGIAGARGCPEALLTPLGNSLPQAGWQDRGFVLAMPGSGLGIGIGLPGGTGLGSEGGNILAALDPEDSLERAAFHFGSQAPAPSSPNVKHPPPSYDTLCSGPGLSLLWEAALSTGEFPIAPEVEVGLRAMPPAVRSQRILPLAIGMDPTSLNQPEHSCAAAIRLFARLLARALQSVAVVTLPETLLLGGTLALALRNVLRVEVSRELVRHPRHGEWLSSLPLLLIEDPEVNLRGGTAEALKLPRS